MSQSHTVLESTGVHPLQQPSASSLPPPPESFPRIFKLVENTNAQYYPEGDQAGNGPSDNPPTAFPTYPEVDTFAEMGELTKFGIRYCWPWLNDKLKFLDHEINELRGSNRATGVEIDNLNAKLLALEGDVHSLKAHNVATEDKNKTYDILLKSQRNNIDTFSRAKKGLEAKVVRLETELVDARQFIRDRDETIRILRSHAARQNEWFQETFSQLFPNIPPPPTLELPPLTTQLSPEHSDDGTFGDDTSDKGSQSSDPFTNPAEN